MKGFLRSACRFFAGAFLLAALVPVVAGANVAYAETNSVAPSTSPSATLAVTGYDYTQRTNNASGLNLSVSWNKPVCGQPTTFHLEGLNGSGNYQYYLNAVFVDDQGYMTEEARVIDPSRTALQKSPDISFTFYASGLYDFMFYLYDVGNNWSYVRLKVRLTVSDSGYPSICRCCRQGCG